MSNQADLQKDVERAEDMWMKSRCTTAFSWALFEEARLNLARAIEGTDSQEYKTQRLSVKAAIRNYQSLCSEAGIQPYEMVSDIRESVGMKA